MSTGSKRIGDLEEVDIIDDKDQLLFFQNSTKKTKKITRKNLAGSRGFGTSITGVVTNDGTPPNIPTGLTVTTATEKDRDGTEKVYIRASINANTESDLDSYGWSIRRVSGTPTFDGGGNLTGYGGTAQIFDAVTNISPAATGTKMQWDVRANIWYEVRVCAIDKTGNASSYTALTSSNVIQSSKDTTAPAAPTSVAATSAIKSVFLSWINPTDADLAFINIYRNTTNTPPTIGTTTPYAKIMSNSYVDSNTTQGTTYYYWLTSVDDSGNETATTSTVVSIQPGLVANTDITTFAVDATKMFTNTVILKADAWTDNSPSAGYIAWNAHTLVYGGSSYDIVAGNTNLQFVYWKGVLSSGSLAIGAKYIIKDNTGANFTSVGAANNNVGTTFIATGTSPTWGTGSLGSLSYTAVNTNPTLTDGQFMIATNADSDGNGTNDGLHDLAWNAIANAVIGSAYIQNAAITNAKVNDLAVDKLTSGSISAKTITLTSGGVIRSSDVSSIDSGSGIWISGTGTTGTGGAEFGIGDFGGLNNGYLKWKTTTNTLDIKGIIKATSGWFGTSDTNGILVDSSGLEVKGTGATDNIGRIKANIDWTNSPARFTINTSGFYLGRASNQYRFFLGETGATGLGGGSYLYWDGTTLNIRGSITATSLSLIGATVPAASVTGLAAVATSGSKSDVGLGNVSNLTPQNQAQTGIEATINIASGGIAMGAGGFVRGGIDWDSANARFTGAGGFFLGYASSQYRFFIGSTGNPGIGSGNYLYWDGSSLKIGGNLVAGTTIGSSGDGSSAYGLVLNSNYGIRHSAAGNAGIITITAGSSNGATNGAQLELHGNGSTGNQGLVTLQAGTGSVSAIRLYTNLATGVSPTTGTLRFDIDTYGTVGIPRAQSGNPATYTDDGISGGAGCLEVDGNVGIGRISERTTVGQGKLWVANEVAVYGASNARNIILTGSSGDVTAVSFTTSSSKKFKTNIKQLNSGIKTIDKLKPVSFKRKGTKQQDIGLIAEEVDKVLPVIVKHNDKNEAEGLDYSKLTVVLINAVKELSAEVKELKKKLKDANTN